MPDDPEFDFQLEDGRTAHCWRVDRQEYSNCLFETGLVEGLEPDNFYIRIVKDEEPLWMFLRKDEFTILAWLINGALWAAEMQERGGNENV